MDSNGGHPGMRRVELDDGQWVDVRRVTGAVLYDLRIKRHERGFEDEVLDALDALPKVIVGWSLGPEVTSERALELSEMDITRIWAAAKGVSLPNPSSPSSAGTERAKGSRRSSGASA